MIKFIIEVRDLGSGCATASVKVEGERGKSITEDKLADALAYAFGKVIKENNGAKSEGSN